MGFFSWHAQDTGRSIANCYSNRPTFRVYMVNPVNDEYWVEDNYEGYGRFGGKDYYELLAEINGRTDRNDGIDLQFDQNTEILTPVLVEDLSKAKDYYGAEPHSCRNQGYFYDDEDDEPVDMFNEETILKDKEFQKRLNDCLEKVREYEEKYGPLT